MVTDKKEVLQGSSLCHISNIYCLVSFEMIFHGVFNDNFELLIINYFLSWQNFLEITLVRLAQLLSTQKLWWWQLLVIKFVSGYRLLKKSNTRSWNDHHVIELTLTAIFNLSNWSTWCISVNNIPDILTIWFFILHLIIDSRKASKYSFRLRRVVQRKARRSKFSKFDPLCRDWDFISMAPLWTNLIFC